MNARPWRFCENAVRKSERGARLLPGGFEAHVGGEIMESGVVFGCTGWQGSTAVFCVASGLFAGPGFYEDGVAGVTQTLKGSIGSAGIDVDLLEKEVDQGLGEVKSVRNVAASVFVDCFLPPRVELFCVERIGLLEENLRGRNNYTDDRARCRFENPNGDGVICGWPQKADAPDAGTLSEERVQGGEFIAFGGRRRFSRRRTNDRFPLAPDPVGIGRLIRDAPMHIPEACVACGFKEQADDHEVRVADARRRKVMGGEERRESEAHAGGIFKSFTFLTNGANKLRKWDNLRGECGLRGCLGMQRDAGRGDEGGNCSKEKRAEQTSHRSPARPSL